jgi:hypothetical protein
MTILYVLVGASVFLGVLNLVALTLLSNALFRFMNLDDQEPPPSPTKEDGGLVDLKDTPTYDPRFRR